MIVHVNTTTFVKEFAETARFLKEILKVSQNETYSTNTNKRKATKMFSKFFNKFFGKTASEPVVENRVPSRKAKPIIDTPNVTGNSSSISEMHEKLQSSGRLASNDMMKLQIEKYLARLAGEKK